MANSLRVFDDRCPLGLRDAPVVECPLAVERLRAIRNKPGTEPTVGCEWYIANRKSNFCFHVFMSQNEGKAHETIDIARLLASTQANIYASWTKAVATVGEAGIGEVLLGEDE